MRTVHLPFLSNELRLDTGPHPTDEETWALSASAVV